MFNQFVRTSGCLFVIFSTTLYGQIVPVSSHACGDALGTTERLYFGRRSNDLDCKFWSYDGRDANLESDILPEFENSSAWNYGQWNDRIIMQTSYGVGEFINRHFQPLLPFSDGYTIYGDKLIIWENFAASLWEYDGHEIRNIYEPFARASDVLEFDGLLYFSGREEEYGHELLAYDGEKVRVAADLHPGVGDSRPTYLNIVGDSLFIYTNRDNTLWRFDSIDYHRIGWFPKDGGSIGPTAAFKGQTYFLAYSLAAEDGTPGPRAGLWATNGQAGDSRLIFRADDSKYEEMTSLPYEAFDGDRQMIIFKDQLWFYRYQHIWMPDLLRFDSTETLWRTDGTEFVDATDEFKIWKESTFVPQIVAQVEDSLFFWAENESREVWLYQNNGRQVRPLLSSDQAPLKEDGTRDILSLHIMHHGTKFQGEWYFVWNDGLWNIANWPTAGACDVDAAGFCDVNDIEALSAAIRGGSLGLKFDLNQDGLLTSLDHEYWVSRLMNTVPGDANLDGQFTSRDFVSVFQAGHYEDGVMKNSTWAEGDWNGDAEFSTADLVLAFQSGAYERGFQLAAVVPEPSQWLWLAVTSPLLCLLRRQCVRTLRRLSPATAR